MLEFGKQLLELAAENAETEQRCTTCECTETVVHMGHTFCKKCGGDGFMEYIDKQSILDTIKQVE